MLFPQQLQLCVSNMILGSQFKKVAYGVAKYCWSVNTDGFTTDVAHS